MHVNEIFFQGCRFHILLTVRHRKRQIANHWSKSASTEAEFLSTISDTVEIRQVSTCRLNSALDPRALDETSASHAKRTGAASFGWVVGYRNVSRDNSVPKLWYTCPRKLERPADLIAELGLGYCCQKQQQCHGRPVEVPQ